MRMIQIILLLHAVHTYILKEKTEIQQRAARVFVTLRQKGLDDVPMNN